MLSRKCSRHEPVQNNRAFFNTIGQLQPYATPQENAHKENFSPKLSVQ
jgi:hypothetical protein